MGDIYAVVKQYATNTDNDFCDWHFKPSDFYGIYDKMMEITDGDHEISSDAASWCELASIGEIYEFREGEIEMQEIQ